MTNDTNIAALIMIRGLPGSGKSYLANALRDSLGQDRVVVLDPDAIDTSSQEYQRLCEKLRAEGIEEKFFPNRYLRAKGHEAILAHKVIIWNQAFTNLGGFNRTIAPQQEFAAEHGIDLPVLVVEVEIAHETAKQRVAERVARGEHDVSEEAFARFIRDYNSFADEGFRVVKVDGEDDVQSSVASVLKALRHSPTD